MLKPSDVVFTKVKKGEALHEFKHGDDVWSVVKNDGGIYKFNVTLNGERVVFSADSLDEIAGKIASIINRNEPVIGKWNASMTAAVRHCQAVGDVRYYLCGVYVAPHPEKGVIIAATNGHVAAIAHDENGYINRPAIFTFDTKFLAAHKTNKKDMFGPRAIETDGKIMYMTFEGRHHADEPVEYGDFGSKNIGVQVKAMQPVDEIDGNYPKLGRVIPEAIWEQGPQIFLNTKYAALADKVIKTFQPAQKSVAMRLGYIKYAEDEKCEGNTAMLVRYSSAKEIVMIIMPMRDDGKSEIPEWLTKFKGAAQ